MFRKYLITVLLAWALPGFAQGVPASGAPPPTVQPQTAVPLPDAPRVPGAAQDAQAGIISGTVTDTSGDLVSGATVALDSAIPADRRSAVTDENGWFAFNGLKPGDSYHITISGAKIVDWASPTISLTAGQLVILKNIQIKIIGGQSSVTVYASTTQIATEQVQVEMQQRVLGIFPNFYVSYDKNPVPLTAKLKFELSLRVSIDPITAAGILFFAGIDQASSTPDYVEGMKGYGQRVGAVAAGGFSDIFIGGAVLPSLLHQDPRYFYQGTGTTKSRLRHALLSPFICKGDNGQWQPNYSTIGGDLASSAISESYYPQSNRGMNLMFGNLAISTAERMASDIAQEFVFRKLTSHAKN